MKKQHYYLAIFFFFFFSFKGCQMNNIDSSYEKFLSEEQRRFPQITLKKIEELKAHVEATNNIPLLNSRDYIIFLHSASYNVDNAYKMLNKNYRIRSELPEIYNSTHPTFEEMGKVYNVTSYSINDRYIYSNIEITDLQQYSFVNNVKYFFMETYSLLLHYGTFDGIVIVMDVKGIGIRQLRKCRYFVITKLMHLMQEAPMIQVKAIHVVNAGLTVKFLYNIMKPWMDSKFVKKVQVYKRKSKDIFAYVPNDIKPPVDQWNNAVKKLNIL